MVEVEMMVVVVVEVSFSRSGIEPELKCQLQSSLVHAEEQVWKSQTQFPGLGWRSWCNPQTGTIVSPR